MAVVVAVVAIAATATFLSQRGSPSPSVARGVVRAVAAENQYGSVLSQIGGRYVVVTSILSNPSSDPHTFEASPAVAEAISGASLVVQNGLGYDTFMNNVESASPNRARLVIVAQNVLGLPITTPNPHLWYWPRTMPLVAAAMAKDLTKLLPRRGSYFSTQLAHFDASLNTWRDAIANFRAHYLGTAVASTEPVANYLLSALGTKNLTPLALQRDVMNGVDPAPEDVTVVERALRHHLVKVFIYNEQVVDSLTNSLRQMAQANHVAVVGVYETMPAPGYDFQSWMTAEVAAIEAAVAHHQSTEKL